MRPKSSFSTRPEGIPKVEDNPNVLKMEQHGNQSSPNEGFPRRPKAITDSPPTELFAKEVAALSEILTPAEQNFLRDRGIEIKAVKRVCDSTDTGSKFAAACYDRGQRAILVAEEVFDKREWKKAFDLPFMLKHEFGHAYNDLKVESDNWLSNKALFRDCYKKDLEDIKKEAPYIFSGTKLDSTIHNAESIRDEVFADLYAHASGLTSKNEYSQRILKYFRNCAEYMNNRTYDKL